MTIEHTDSTGRVRKHQQTIVYSMHARDDETQKRSDMISVSSKRSDDVLVDSRVTFSIGRAGENIERSGNAFEVVFNGDDFAAAIRGERVVRDGVRLVHVPTSEPRKKRYQLRWS